MAIETTSATWEYDGSFSGFLTVVYHAFKRQQFPMEILTPETATTSLFFSEWIETDQALAKRIFIRLASQIKKENLQFIQEGFHATLANKECYLLEAVKISLQTNDRLENHIGHPAILELQKGIKALLNEAHLLKGFIRFEYIEDVLFSKIAPKHLSIFYICYHFATRYPQETLLIYDETHRILATIKKRKISFTEDMDCPATLAPANEDSAPKQWRAFLEAITINERINPNVQRSHLPLRFRGNMVDFK